MRWKKAVDCQIDWIAKELVQIHTKMGNYAFDASDRRLKQKREYREKIKQLEWRIRKLEDVCQNLEEYLQYVDNRLMILENNNENIRPTRDAQPGGDSSK